MGANFAETINKASTLIGFLNVCDRMGITPEQIMEWAEAVEEGRMVMLPCKPGDDLYWLDDEFDGEKDVLCVKCERRGVGAVVVRGKDDFAIIGRDSLSDCSEIEEIGERWSYLTAYDAEAAVEIVNK